MKSVSKKIINRLVAEANEADIHGEIKIADAITCQIEKLAVRDAEQDKEYTYSKEELEEDINSLLWQAVARIFDYYNETIDSRMIDEIVSFETTSFIESIESKMHNKVGAYEEKTPGENSDSEVEDVEDDFDKPVDDDEQIVVYDDDEDEDEEESDDDDDK